MTAQLAGGVGSRAAALDILRETLTNNRQMDETIAGHAGLAVLDRRDRAFVRLLVATTLRRLGQLDALIGHCLARPLPDRAGEVRDILRLGMCQLLLLGTPPHAAVDSAVRLAIARGHHHHKKLVNAVLRRMAREGAALIEEQDAARLNTPDWLWRSWEEAYGATNCRRIAERHLEEPPLDITVKQDPDRWAAALDAERLPTGTLRLRHGGVPPELPGFQDGAWWVQDAAAALPARLLVAALGEGIQGSHIIDLCAAPGGKTAQLAAAGARVTAVDFSAARLDRVRENLARLGLSAELIEADAERWRPAAPADAVLLDAPCTATGTIRRHPDVAHAKTPQQVTRQAGVQRKLLAAAAAMVRPGGILVYSVCSLQPEEGEAQIEAFLDARADFSRVAVNADDVGGLEEFLAPAGDVRTLPCHMEEAGGVDGFFVARLRRQ